MNQPYKLWNKAGGRWYDETTDCRIFYMQDGSLLQQTVIGFFEVTDEYEKYDCIGLPDENGKMVFEGDIVGQLGYKYIVNWNFNRWVLKSTGKSKKIRNIDKLSIEAGFFKIIGHIKTDAHLLEAK